MKFRRSISLVILLLPGIAFGATSGGTAPEPILVLLAHQKLEKVRGLVASGILPRVQLAEAERAYENSKDDPGNKLFKTCHSL